MLDEPAPANPERAENAEQCRERRECGVCPRSVSGAGLRQLPDVLLLGCTALASVRLTIFDLGYVLAARILLGGFATIGLACLGCGTFFSGNVTLLGVRFTGEQRGNAFEHAFPLRQHQRANLFGPSRTGRQALR